MEIDNSGGSILRLHLIKRKSSTGSNDHQPKVRQEIVATAAVGSEGHLPNGCTGYAARSSSLNGLRLDYNRHNVHSGDAATHNMMNTTNLLDDQDHQNNYNNEDINKGRTMKQLLPKGASFSSWSVEDAVSMVKHHPVPCMFTFSLLFFMGVEYTLRMVPPSSPPWDVGFILTQSLHGLLAASPALNSVLAALNTVFVGMQTTYILWTLLVEGRGRCTIAALFMFTCRGILGYSTQLPLPQGFLGSGVDFPVGNVSFFLFFSGHVAGSVIASLDMRRMRRQRMAWTFDALNILQALRLLATRGHYTIDLAVGIGAGFLSDVLAGKYQETKSPPINDHQDHNPATTVADSYFQRLGTAPCCRCSCR